MRVRFSLLALGFAALAPALAPTPALAGGRGGAAHKLAVAHLGAGAKDVTVLASADAGSSPGSAAIVRVDNGGGAPRCSLLVFEGRSAAPEKVVAAEKLSVCPAYDKDKQPAALERVPLTERRGAWRVHLGSKRMDAMAGGVETRQLWALVADTGSGMHVVFERTSTSFKGQKDASANSSEVCEAPVLPLGSEPSTLTITCDTMAMLGAAAKKQRSTFSYSWQGDRFGLE